MVETLMAMLAEVANNNTCNIDYCRVEFER